MNKIYIGIDPGKQGFIAILHDDDSGFLEELPFKPVPNGSRNETRIDGRKFRKMIPSIRSTVILEKTQSYGVRPHTMFDMGQTRGIIVGILDDCMMPLIEVTPQQWKKHFGLPQGREPGETKAEARKRAKKASIALAKKMFPRFAKQIGENDNKAEALLLARYGKDLGL